MKYRSFVVRVKHACGHEIEYVDGTGMRTDIPIQRLAEVPCEECLRAELERVREEVKTQKESEPTLLGRVVHHVRHCAACSFTLQDGHPIFFKDDLSCFRPQVQADLEQVFCYIDPPAADYWQDGDRNLQAAYWVSQAPIVLRPISPEEIASHIIGCKTCQVRLVEGQACYYSRPHSSVLECRVPRDEKEADEAEAVLLGPPTTWFDKVPEELVADAASLWPLLSEEVEIR